MNEQINWTQNYETFKTLNGNREVKDGRKEKLIESIRTVGFLTNPLIVNEKMQVIDGQGRLAALEELNEPVPYIVIPGIGDKECQALNLYNTKWNVANFIDYYAANGNDNYVRLKNMISSYKDIPLKAIQFAVDLSNHGNDEVRDGSFSCSADEYVEAIRRLEYSNQFAEIAKGINGRRQFFITAVMFAFYDEHVDNDRLTKNINAYHNNLIPISREKNAYEGLSAIYNYRNKRENIFLWEDYCRYWDKSPNKPHHMNPASAGLYNQR